MALFLYVVGAILVSTPTINGSITDCFYAKDVCPNQHISFWLRTRKTGKEGIEITEGNIEKVPFVDRAPLKVLIHGYKGHKHYSPNPELVEAYLKKGDYNIIIVDWGKLARKGCYHTACFNYAIAAKCTASLLNQIYSRKGHHWKQVTHVIGFSMGAHVAGVLGHTLSELPRITGLDPALPWFSTSTALQSSRLDPSDAAFVDVYHSNSGLKGRPGPLGHVDFYLNNGGSQPGCSDASCNHHRAVEMFAESINNPEGFYARSCIPHVKAFMAGLQKEVCPYSNNQNIFVRAGEYVSQKAKGPYKFETNSKPPFAKGLPHARKKDSKIL